VHCIEGQDGNAVDEESENKAMMLSPKDITANLWAGEGFQK
jgi:hypothetical protein